MWFRPHNPPLQIAATQLSGGLLNKINFPTTDSKKETQTILIDLYEKTVNDLNRDIDRIKGYLHEFEREEKHE